MKINAPQLQNLIWRAKAMKTADKNEVLEFIKKDKLQFFNEYKAILEEECEIITDDNASSFMLLQNYSYGLFASFIGFNNDFFNSCLSLLEKDHKTVNIAIPMPPFQTPDINNQEKLISRGVYKAFAGNGKTTDTENTISDLSIRPLTKADEKIVSSFKEEKHSNMIQLDAAFNDLVVNNNGEIYGYIDKKGKLVGYLSCCPEVDNIWDVIYIYVQRRHRSSGIGTKLAAYYLHTKLKNNQIPYYSGVTNPASEAAALKAGFTLCGERFSYEYNC